MPAFTAQQRLDITRRQLNIVTENNAYTTAQAGMMANQTKLLNVDAANNVFYSFFDTQVRSYEAEAQAINGTMSAEYMNSDIIAAAQTPGSVLFFPSSPPYSFLIPKIVPQVNGYLNPTGTATLYEQNTINNFSNPAEGLTQLLNFLLNGITGGTTDTETIVSFDGTNLIIGSGTTNIAPGDYVYVGTSADSGIYKVLTVTPMTPIGSEATLTVSTIIPATSIPSSGTVKNTVPGFTNAERTTLTSTSWQNILTNLTNQIFLVINTNWNGFLSTQVTNLTAQNDTRSPESTQNSTALTNAQSAQTVIAAWVALPNTGAGGKYTDTELSTIQSLMTARTSFTATRISQIATSLGFVIDNGDGTFSDGGTNSSYYNRYSWLNIRINKLTGSLTRYYALNGAVGANTTLIAANNNLQSQYGAYFATVALSVIDGTNIVGVTSTTGFSVLDSVTVVSETQPELPATIESILGPQSFKLNVQVPVTYLTNQKDLARVFKQL